MRSSTPISPCIHRSSGVVTRTPPPATRSSVIAATMAVPPSQTSFMCPASSTMSSLPVWTSSLPSTVVCEVRHLFGEPVAGVLVERALHAHAVAPGDGVGVFLRASGLDALGLAAAQRIAPDELLDGLGPHLQSEGAGGRGEVGVRHGPRTGIEEQVVARLENGQLGVPRDRIPCPVIVGPGHGSSDGSCDGSAPLSSGGGRGGCGGDFPDDIDKGARQE